MHASGLARGTREYTRAVMALLAAGLAIFNALYCTQAMLPTLVETLDMSATTASLTISAATGALACSIIPISALSERFGRGRVLIISALAATGIGLLLPLAPNAATLIGLRFAQGICIAGVPAVAMTWLSEEVRVLDQPHAMGIYIAGNSVGGLVGRLLPALALEVVNWRWALLLASASALLAALIMAALLPRQRRFMPRRLSFADEAQAMLQHLKTPQLALLYFVGLSAMGCFVSMYNYFGFRMVHTFGLSQGLVGLVFLMYLAGTWSSARAGAWVARLGRGRALMLGASVMASGLLLMFPATLWVTFPGLLLFTAAFFFVHSTASSWVGLMATHHRAEGTSLYLLSYYVGSSLVGWLSGVAFEAWGWTGFVCWLLGWMALLLGAAAATARQAACEAVRLEVRSTVR